MRGAASLPDLHVVWDGFALAAQLDVEHSRVSGAERLQPHVHPLLAGHPSTWGGKQRAAGAGGRALGPVAPPLNTYEVLGTRGCGCNRRAVGFDRSAPARQSPRGWLLPARDGGLATGLERGRGPGLGPAQHQDLDRDQLSPRMRTGAGTWIGTSSAPRSRLGPAQPQDEDGGSAPVLGPVLGPAQH